MKARVLTIAVVLALSGTAAAQSTSLTLQNAPSTAEITAGDTFSASLDVNLQVAGVDCAEPVDVPVNVTVEPAATTPPTNASHTASPVALTFTVPEGSHRSTGTPLDNQTGGPYNETQGADISVETSSGVRSNYTLNVDLTGETPGAAAMSCSGQIPSATSDPVTIEVTVIADNPPEPSDGDDDSGPGTTPPANTTGNQTGDDGGNGIPAPGALVPLAAIGAALAARRRD